MTIHCDYCNRPAVLVTGRETYPHRADLRKLKFWSCAACKAWVGCHKNGDGKTPLGRLANAELRAAKSAAHAAFDPLWREGAMSRSSAYAWLARQLGISAPKCHIGMFDVQTCQRVVDIVIAREFA